MENQAQEVVVPEIGIPDKDTEINQGKIKKIFRRLQGNLVAEIQRRLDHLNAQINTVDAKLDKKYGGMYKVLIHQYLTKQENKLYNIEIQIIALRETLADYIYSHEKSVDSKEEFTKKFMEQYQAKLYECKETIDGEIKKRQEQGDGEGETGSPKKVPEEKQAGESKPEEVPNSDK